MTQFEEKVAELKAALAPFRQALHNALARLRVGSLVRLDPFPGLYVVRAVEPQSHDGVVQRIRYILRDEQNQMTSLVLEADTGKVTSTRMACDDFGEEYAEEVEVHVISTEFTLEEARAAGPRVHLAVLEDRNSALMLMRADARHKVHSLRRQLEASTLAKQLDAAEAELKSLDARCTELDKQVELVAQLTENPNLAALDEADSAFLAQFPPGSGIELDGRLFEVGPLEQHPTKPGRLLYRLYRDGKADGAIRVDLDGLKVWRITVRYRCPKGIAHYEVGLEDHVTYVEDPDTDVALNRAQ